MVEQVHPQLARIVSERDELRRQLRAERIKSGHLKPKLDKMMQRTTNAKPQPERRLSC